MAVDEESGRQGNRPLRDDGEQAGQAWASEAGAGDEKIDYLGWHVRLFAA
jgi:hypothetical protein